MPTHHVAFIFCCMNLKLCRFLVGLGTRIIQASDCFVDWRDTKCDREWGLNFTVPLDARRFRECCMVSPHWMFAILFHIFSLLHLLTSPFKVMDAVPQDP